MKVFLIAAKGKQKGTPIPIKVDLFLLGSEKICQLRSAHPRIGAQHCAIVTRERKVFVRDLDSGQPTLVNDAPVPPGQEWPLHAGDRLVVGPLQFVVQFREKPLSQRDLEEWALKCLDVTSEQEMVGTEDNQLAHYSEEFVNASQAAASILDKLQAKRGVVKGRLRVGAEGNITIIRFNDRYLVDESELTLVRKELFDNVNQPHMRVLLDFKNVRRMSSTATAMISELYEAINSGGGHLALCRLRPELQGILQTLHLSDKIHLFMDKRVAFTRPW